MSITIWIIIIMGLTLLYFVEKRFNKIENYINIPKPSKENAGKLKPISYRIEVSVEPDWIKVLKWCCPNLRTDDEASKFVNTILEDHELNLDKERSLFGKNFDFIEYYDEISGLNLIWSSNRNTFINDLVVSGYLFAGTDYNKMIKNKFPANPITGFASFSPRFIRFERDIFSDETDYKSEISQFPYYQVINFFTDIQRYTGTVWGGEMMVKKFPKNIQFYFDEYQVEYDAWNYEHYDTGVNACQETIKSKWLEDRGIELYNQKMRSHTFKTPYYTLCIRLKFFSPDDRGKNWYF